MTPALMYHELETSGHRLAETDPGYVRYVVPEDRFADQLSWLADNGFRGVSLSDALDRGLEAADQVILTFDDGCESDWTTAAPALRGRGFTATFYVVSEWIGRRHGFLSAPQLRSLSEAGFEIGSHSATHAFLTELPDGELWRELTESKARIEDQIGCEVTHLSCPGGRASRRVADAARRAGYATMATSRVALNGPATDRYALARLAVQRTTPRGVLEAFCRGRGLTPLVMRDRTLAAARALVGERLYASIRGLALRAGR